jgi:putative transposase
MIAEGATDEEVSIPEFRFTDSQAMAILKQHEAGVSVAELSREHNVGSALLQSVALEVWQHGRLHGGAAEGAGSRECPPEENVCRRRKKPQMRKEVLGGKL